MKAEPSKYGSPPEVLFVVAILTVAVPLDMASSARSGNPYGASFFVLPSTWTFQSCEPAAYVIAPSLSLQVVSIWLLVIVSVALVVHPIATPPTYTITILPLIVPAVTAISLCFKL